MGSDPFNRLPKFELAVLAIFLFLTFFMKLKKTFLSYGQRTN